jgi:hypothetical protein
MCMIMSFSRHSSFRKLTQVIAVCSKPTDKGDSSGSAPDLFLGDARFGTRSRQ